MVKALESLLRLRLRMGLPCLVGGVLVPSAVLGVLTENGLLCGEEMVGPASLIVSLFVPLFVSLMSLSMLVPSVRSGPQPS